MQRYSAMRRTWRAVRNMERHPETFGDALQLFDGGVILSATNLVQILFGPA